MNKVAYFEIPFDDAERSQKFYKEVFGWQINKVPEMDYFMAMTADSDQTTMTPKEPGSINGGLLKKDPTGEHPLIVIEVPSVDEHIKKIEEAGGKKITPKADIGEFGFYARIADTEDNIVGLWEKRKK